MSFRPPLAAFGLLLCVISTAPVLAQAPASSAPANPFAGLVRIGGTVASASGNSFVVHSQQGGDLRLTFPDKPNIMVSGKGSVADLGRRQIRRLHGRQARRQPATCNRMPYFSGVHAGHG